MCIPCVMCGACMSADNASAVADGRCPACGAPVAPDDVSCPSCYAFLYRRPAAHAAGQHAAGPPSADSPAPFASDSPSDEATRTTS